VKINAIISCLTSLLLFGCIPRPALRATTKTHSLPFWGNEDRLHIELPSGFTMGRQQGPDFDVFYFSDSFTKSTMGFYVGHNPGLRSSEANIGNVQRQAGRIGDASVEWFRWSQDERHHSETLVRGLYGQNAPREYAGVVLHIFTAATTKQDVARMETAATTLRLERVR
jgi:hypothetical protein